MPEKEKDKEKEEKVDMKALSELLEKMPASMQTAVTAAIRGENDRIAAARAKAKAEEEDNEDIFEDDTDVNELDNKGLVDHMTKVFSKVLDKSLKPIVTSIEEVSQESETDRLRREFSDVRSRHDDFDQWKQEMAPIAKSNPGMAVEDIYLLAKSKHPDKVKEMETKASEEKEKEEKKNKDLEGAFGGLLPTSGSGPSNDDGEKKMGSKEASLDAWEKAMANVPEEFLNAG